MKLSQRSKGKIIQLAAVALDVGAPLVATLTQFPVWIQRSAESTVSGLFVVFALLSAIPLIRYFKDMFRSPSATIIFGLLLIALIGLKDIIDEMIIVSLVGLISNFVGARVYNAGQGFIDKEKNNA